MTLTGLFGKGIALVSAIAGLASLGFGAVPNNQGYQRVKALESNSYHSLMLKKASPKQYILDLAYSLPEVVRLKKESGLGKILIAPNEDELKKFVESDLQLMLPKDAKLSKKDLAKILNDSLENMCALEKAGKIHVFPSNAYSFDKRIDEKIVIPSLYLEIIANPETGPVVIEDIKNDIEYAAIRGRLYHHGINLKKGGELLHIGRENVERKEIGNKFVENMVHFISTYEMIGKNVKESERVDGGHDILPRVSIEQMYFLIRKNWEAREALWGSEMKPLEREIVNTLEREYENVQVEKNPKNSKELIVIVLDPKPGWSMIIPLKEE